MPCLRCGKPSIYQWQICSLGKWVGICAKCDIELNKTVLKFMRVKNWTEIMGKYKKLKDKNNEN